MRSPPVGGAASLANWACGLRHIFPRRLRSAEDLAYGVHQPSPAAGVDCDADSPAVSQSDPVYAVPLVDAEVGSCTAAVGADQPDRAGRAAPDVLAQARQWDPPRASLAMEDLAGGVHQPRRTVGSHADRADEPPNSAQSDGVLRQVDGRTRPVPRGVGQKAWPRGGVAPGEDRLEHELRPGKTVGREVSVRRPETELNRQAWL